MTKKSQRGFSLIEAAIVLAIVGLVIGGIWVAAAAVMDKLKLNDAIKGINFTVSKTQNLFTLQAAAAIGSNMITSTLGDAGGLPADWITGGNFAKFPLGKSIAVYNGMGWFNILLDGVPKKACIGLITRISALSLKTSTLATGHIVVSPSGPPLGFYTSDFPVSPQTAAAACSSSNQIEMSYGYTRNN